MNALPPEIMTHVLAQLDGSVHTNVHTMRPPQLSAYSTISRRWQQVVECFTLKNLKVTTNSLNLLQGLYRIDHEHRLECTKDIYFVIQLPYIIGKTDDTAVRESYAMQNGKVFEASVFTMLRILSEAAQLSGPPQRRGLGLRVVQEYFPEDREAQDFWCGWWEQRSDDTFLRLQSTSNLPHSSLVTGLRISSSKPFVVDPASSIAILSAFPACKSASIDTNDKVSRNARPGIEPQQRLAQALNRLHGSSLTFLLMDFNRWSPRNEYDMLTRIVNSNEEESLNLSLHALLQKSSLTSVRLTGCHIVSPALFWPASADSNPPFWPNLKSLHIELDTTTSDGQWYFVEDTDPRTRLPRGAKFSINDLHDAQDCDGACGYRVQPKGNVMRRFRSLPNSDTVEPLMIAMAKAARHMPAVETLTLTRERPVEGLIDVLERRKSVRQFHLRYQVKGTTKSLQLSTGAWRPAEAVLNEWRKTVGEDGRVEFLQEEIDEDDFLSG